MSDKAVTLVSHIEELRRRIILASVAVFVGTCVCFYFRDQILAILCRDAGNMVFITPGEAFFASLKLSLVSGLVISSPIVLYQVWAFISTGLQQRERKLVLLYFPLSLTLFLGGALFCYFIILPFTMRYLLGFATARLQPMISVDRYVSFAGTLIVSTGAAFELPLVIMLLANLGIVSPDGLRRKRKTSIFLLFILAAIITPSPDAVSQILVALPLIILYEVGILLAVLVNPIRKTVPKKKTSG